MNAQEWLTRGDANPSVTVFGAPISKASISPSDAWATPPAVREALARFPTWDAAHSTDLEVLAVRDLGDVEGDRNDADALAAHGRIQQRAREAASGGAVVAIFGGDNSLTRPAMQGVMSTAAGSTWGLLTLDAHHDCRPLDAGSRNGTPVRELIEAGLPGQRVAQVGINAFGNHRAHAEWAAAQRVRVYPISEVRSAGIATTVISAVTTLLRAGADAIYVDVDLDVVDRAFAPACPASLPGGILPADLLEATHLLGGMPHVRAIDFTEVDAKADINAITLRLTAAAFLSFCSGAAARLHPGAVR